MLYKRKIMKVIDKGHTYNLKCNGSNKHVKLTFFKDGKINNSESISGTTNQEVVRALIDRVKFLDNQRPHHVNERIIKLLREILALHEIRHIERCLEDNLELESVECPKNSDGVVYDHWIPNKQLFTKKT